MNIFKAILHNIGVVAVGFALAYGCWLIDGLLGTRFSSAAAMWVGWILITLGFLLRVWATYHFYVHRMRVISLKAQNTLITDGPYGFTRNPLYLGGNVFVFIGASLVLGTSVGIILTVLHLVLIDRFIKREEKQLAATFGEEWASYAARVRRWI